MYSAHMLQSHVRRLSHVRRFSPTHLDEPLLVRLLSRTPLLSRRQIRKRVCARRKLAVLVVLVHELVVLDVRRELCERRCQA